AAGVRALILRGPATSSVLPRRAPPLVGGFLKGLELRPGSFVKRELRVRRSGRCPACGVDYEYTTEKRVDTRLVAEMIHYAAIGAFAAAGVVSRRAASEPAQEALHPARPQHPLDT